MQLFRTFQAKIHGTIAPVTGNEPPIDEIITFSRYRIILKKEQINRIFYTPVQQQPITHRSQYEFDKILNKNDKKMFAIILKERLNKLDSGIKFLDISMWNKIKANIIHHRYWIDREKEWFLKSIITAAIGAIFAIMGAYVGYKAGFQNGKATKTTTPQDTSLPSRR